MSNGTADRILHAAGFDHDAAEIFVKSPDAALMYMISNILEEIIAAIR